MQRAHQVVERILVQRPDLAQQPLGVDNAHLRQDRRRLSPLDESDREMEFAGLLLAGQSDHKEGLLVEASDDDHGPVEALSRAVLLETDVGAEGAPPDFPVVVEGRVVTQMQLLLFCAPRVKVLGHK